ncbi:hypothetical protein EDB87DRAFT_1681312 [Lactarius vividus]|nr:hypothetical protein EDB87DRAFT_1681312 [Lactarius vividus]
MLQGPTSAITSSIIPVGGTSVKSPLSRRTFLSTFPSILIGIPSEPTSVIWQFSPTLPITIASAQKGTHVTPTPKSGQRVTFDLPTRPNTPPCDSSPVQFVAWKPANPRHALDADAMAAEEAEARERLWKFHQDHALHLRAAILSSRFTIPQDPPQGPED